MKYMVTWSARPGMMEEAVKRFLTLGDMNPPGSRVLARWHKADCSGGVTVWESDDPQAMYEIAARWSGILEMRTDVVLEDAGIAGIWAKVLAKETQA